MKERTLKKIYFNLFKYFGPQKWWPMRSTSSKKNKTFFSSFDDYDARFEIIIGAILTQNTSWSNVEKALDNLYTKNLMSVKTMENVRMDVLKRALIPAGYFNQKAKKLKKFLEHLSQHHHGNLDSLLHLSLKKQRKELLSIWGIGEETADSILLYAAEKPSFVIDAYTKRFCAYQKIQFSKYQEYKNFFEAELPRSVKLFNEYHALIVAWGKLENRKETKNLAKELIKSH